MLTGDLDLVTALYANQRANGDCCVYQEDDGYYKVNTYTISASAHLPPLVGITSPPNRAPYALGANIPIIALAYATPGSTIAGVGLYMDGIYQGAMTAGSGSSFTYTLTPPLGVHTLTCLATDLQGATTTSIASTVQVTNTGLLDWWKFDDASGSTAIDSSGIGNTLTLSNATWVTGKFSDAIDFNGGGAGGGVSEAFTMGGPVPRNALSVAVWAQSASSTWNGGLFLCQDWNYCFNPIYQGTGFSFALTNGGDTGSWNTLVSYTPPAGFDITQWHHYAVTYDGTTAILYLDGAQVASAPIRYPSSRIISIAWPPAGRHPLT